MNKKNKIPPPERRVAPKLPDEVLYKAKSIDAFVVKERRKDELLRLKEVRDQKRVWRTITILCVLVNAVFLILAFYGWSLNGFS